MSSFASEKGGSTGARSEDVPEALVDCHARLRQLTGRATALGASPGATAEAVREVAEKLYRYLTVSLPLHEEDEEASLFPRLLRQAPELAPTLAALRADHQVQAQRVAPLVSLCQRVQRAPEQAAALAGTLAAAAKAIQDVFQTHLVTEERDVFPSVRRVLADSARAEIREEMRARRAHLPR